MTSPDHNYDDVLRRAFHAMADPIEPVGDGLVRIRTQIDGPWLRRQSKLLFTECVDLVVLLYVRSEPFLAWLRGSVVNAAGVAWFGLTTACRRAADGVGAAPGALHRSYWALRDRFTSLRFRGSGWAFVPEAGKPAPRQESYSPAHRVPQPSRRPHSGVTATLAWLRPALAVTSVLVVVAVGALGVPKFRDSLINPTADRGASSSNQGSGGGIGGSGGSDGAGPAGAVGPAFRHKLNSGVTGNKTHAGSASPTPQPTGCSSVAPSPSTSPTTSATPTPTASPTPSSTPSSSPTATPSATPDPASENTPTPTPSGAGAAAVSRLDTRAAVKSPCLPSPGASLPSAPGPTGSPSSPSAASVNRNSVTQSAAAHRLHPASRTS